MSRIRWTTPALDRIGWGNTAMSRCVWRKSNCSVSRWNRNWSPFDKEKQNFYEKYDVTIMTQRKLMPHYKGIGQTWNPTSPGHQKASKSFANYAKKWRQWKRQLCHRILAEVLRQRLKVKSMRFKVFEETYKQNRILWTIWMKSTLIRFKVSGLMKVLLHRHHPSEESRNQKSVIYQKLGVTPSCSYKESMQCRKQYQSWLQLRVRHQRASRNPSGSTQFFISDDFFRFKEQKLQWKRSRGNNYWQVAFNQ